MDESKATIENLQRSVQDAKDKQRVAQEEVKKLERDMEEFKNNKEGKIEELKVPISLSLFLVGLLLVSQANISKQKAALQRHAVVLKTEQRELQTVVLELGGFLWQWHSPKYILLFIMPLLWLRLILLYAFRTNRE